MLQNSCQGTALSFCDTDAKFKLTTKTPMQATNILLKYVKYNFFLRGPPLPIKSTGAAVAAIEKVDVIIVVLFVLVFVVVVVVVVAVVAVIVVVVVVGCCLY